MAPVTVALVNDYDIVLAGLATMLKPFRDRITVLDRAVDRVPTRRWTSPCTTRTARWKARWSASVRSSRTRSPVGS